MAKAQLNMVDLIERENGRAYDLYAIYEILFLLRKDYQ
jgi:hypothetical protein